MQGSRKIGDFVGRYADREDHSGEEPSGEPDREASVIGISEKGALRSASFFHSWVEFCGCFSVPRGTEWKKVYEKIRIFRKKSLTSRGGVRIISSLAMFNGP